MRRIPRLRPIEEIAEPPKNKRRAIVVAVVLVLLVGAGGGALWFFRLRPRPKPADAYARLYGCVVGDPLEEGETLESRLRSVDAALGEERGDWPARCKAPLTTFYENLDTDAKSEGLREILELEVRCKESCSPEALIRKIGQVHEMAESTGIRIKGDYPRDGAPPRLAGKPLKAADFRDVVPGTVSLQGMTSLGDGKTALLYKDTVGILHVCEIEPDGEKPVTCAPIDVPVGAGTARLVEGKTKPTIYGVVSMGATPEETKYGVYDARIGQPTEDDPASVKSSSDRPRLPASSPTWVDAELDGSKVKVQRTKNGVLRLDRGADSPRIVMDDAEHGGPSTGEPVAFVGKKRAVVLFTAKQGMAALVVKGDGAVDPVK